MICTSSYEAQVFKKNLDMLIKENIQETGFDPRIGGPPEHIANQEVKIHNDVGGGEVTVVVKKSPDPHYFKTTQCIFKRRYQVCKSEMERMKRASFDEKI